MGTTTVYRIIIVPGAVTTLFAATNIGLFRYQEDGQDCWQSLSGGLPSSWSSDLVIDPFHKALYAAFPGTGLYKSNDLTGNQWSALAGGFPSPTGTPYVARIALAFGGRTGVGFSAPLPLVYAGFGLSDQTYRLFVTRDGGGTWNELPAPPHDGQLEFNNVIAVGAYSAPMRSTSVSRSLSGARWTVADWAARTTTSRSRRSRTSPGRHLAAASHSRIHSGSAWTCTPTFMTFSSRASRERFTPDPSQVELMFVANDGGLTRGRVDFNGVVTWTPLSRGLAIGQAQYIGLSAGDPTVSVSRFWHNGNAVLLPALQQQLPVGGGDGQTIRVDAGSGELYYDCNIVFGASLCRSPPPSGGAVGPSETIWSQSTRGIHWTDPYRPGHLLRLDASTGLIFRTTVADHGSAATLSSPDSWQAVDPFWGKTGKTSLLTFRSRLLEEQPVYYLGTETGQVWRGSPEVAWSKVCECGNAKVLSIAADLVHDERIFVTLEGPTSPGRIKELVRLASGSWSMTNIDTTFAPEVSVDHVTSIVVDPHADGR